LDQRVIVAARARARRRGTTFGSAVSDLALAGLAAEAAETAPVHRGLVMLPYEPGHVVTDEMVADALAEE
ncbi:MAG: hypothetical protein ACRCZD_16730, partial [Phycicoccus sp.]